MPGRGALEVICGPMFSGKTDELIDRYERARAGARSVVALKPVRDSRHPPDRIVSHSGRDIPARSVSSPDDVGQHHVGEHRVSERRVSEHRVSEDRVVLIDEIQFFDVELVNAVDALRARGVDVVAVGLDRDFRRDAFETTAALAGAADDVVRLTGTCARCGAGATLTQRLLDGVPTPLEAPRLLVGDAELYEPRCERCWVEERAAVPSGARARVREP